MLSEGDTLAKSVTNSFSESRSEKVSKDGKPLSVGAPIESKEFVNCDSGLTNTDSPCSMNLCSSSSPGQSVGKGGNSSPTLLKLEFADSTTKLRGSQKS